MMSMSMSKQFNEGLQEYRYANNKIAMNEYRYDMIDWGIVNRWKRVYIVKSEINEIVRQEHYYFDNAEEYNEIGTLQYTNSTQKTYTHTILQHRNGDIYAVCGTYLVCLFRDITRYEPIKTKMITTLDGHAICIDSAGIIAEKTGYDRGGKSIKYKAIRTDNKHKYIHRIIAQNFLPIPLMQAWDCDHISDDENHENNAVINLQILPAHTEIWGVYVDGDNIIRSCKNLNAHLHGLRKCLKAWICGDLQTVRKYNMLMTSSVEE